MTVIRPNANRSRPQREGEEGIEEACAEPLRHRLGGVGREGGSRARVGRSTFEQRDPGKAYTPTTYEKNRRSVSRVFQRLELMYVHTHLRAQKGTSDGGEREKDINAEEPAL